MLTDPSLLPQPAHHTELPAPRTGYVTGCDALVIGRAGVRLGAGRARKEDSVDPAVGFTITAKVGERVTEGDPLAKIGWNDEARLDSAMELLAGAWEIGDEPPADRPLIIGEVR